METTTTVRRPNGVTLKGDGPYTVCPVCGKQIHFIKTVAGKQMPCEIDLKAGDGRVTLVTHEGRTVRKAGADVAGYEPHWGYCTERRSFGQLVCKHEGGAV
ncbi:MAG: hypothetical protein HGB04_01705 [Chlorobiaceae bacterium]|nr:hypothetical protein [Chlorobiaceae bacterium]